MKRPNISSALCAWITSPIVRQHAVTQLVIVYKHGDVVCSKDRIEPRSDDRPTIAIIVPPIRNYEPSDLIEMIMNERRDGSETGIKEDARRIASKMGLTIVAL